MTYNRHIYTNEELLDAIKNSTTWAEVCRKLGVIPATGSQTNLTNRARAINADTTHFLGQAHNRGKIIGPKIPIEEYLQENKNISSSNLKRRLIKEQLKENKCESCGISEWLGESNIIELDHINNNHFDNRLENLQFLCPNCHYLKTRKTQIKRKSRGIPTAEENGLDPFQSQFKSESRYQKKIRENWPSKEELESLVWIKTLADIGKQYKVHYSTVAKWADIYGIDRPPSFYWTRKVVIPSEEELSKLLWEKPTTEIAKEYNVTDSAVAKWAKMYKISKPPRGYWTKYKKERLWT